MTQSALWRFFYRDVKPAIRARRKVPQNGPRGDVIGHLIDKGYKDFEILTECVTYAAAGMVTTREFIVMAAWHLLEDDTLKTHYLEADKAGRQRVLEEILRLESPAAHPPVFESQAVPESVAGRSVAAWCASARRRPPRHRRSARCEK